MAHYAIIGQGSIGRRHRDNLTALGRETRVLSWRAKAPGDLEALLNGASGAVIATATDIRLELVEACAARNIPVYIEKPLAFRVADLEALLQAARPIAARSVAGYMMRYHPAFLAQIEAPVAQPYGFALEIGHDVRQWRANWRFGDSYAARAEGGGVLLDLCHELDMAHVLFPQMNLLSVESIGHADFPGVDFATRIMLGAEGGPVGSVAMDYLAPAGLRRMGLRGRDQVVDLDLLALEERRSDGGDPVLRRWDFERNDMFLGIMGDFIALAEGGTLSDNPLLPRLDRVEGSARLIASAWEARRFNGMIEGGFA